MKTFVFAVMLLSVLWLSLDIAHATTISWASVVSNSTVPTVYPAEDALGQPDNLVANFYDGVSTTTEQASYSGFGSGDSADYDSAALATFLGTSESFISQADFISFEFNGNGNNLFESSTWVFDDGVNSVTTSYVFNTPASGSIISVGNISRADYAAFWGLPILGEVDDGWAYILFDIDGFSNVNPFAPGFSVTLSAIGSLNIDGPDPDAMGRLGTTSVPVTVPEPSTMLLLGAGLAGLAVYRRKPKK